MVRFAIAVASVLVGCSGHARPTVPPAGTADAYLACLAEVGRKNWQAWGACYASDAVSTYADTGRPALHGRDAIVSGGLPALATALPDLEAHPVLVLRNGSKLASVITLTGSHEGPLVTALGTVPATHKKIGVYAIQVAELHGNAIAKDWYFADVRTVHGQIGTWGGAHREPVAPASASPTIVIAKNDATEQANLATYRRSVDAFNRHDAAAFDALLAPDYQNIYASEAKDVTREEKSKQHTGAFALFSDLAWTPADIWAAGDYVVAVATITGTNDGDFSPDTPKTGKKIDLTGVEIMRFEGGKVKQHWEFFNAEALALQLGFLKKL
ncbi:MAG: ester cyclase [Kofleriaceae bacterium]